MIRRSLFFVLMLALGVLMLACSEQPANPAAPAGDEASADKRVTPTPDLPVPAVSQDYLQGLKDAIHYMDTYALWDTYTLDPIKDGTGLFQVLPEGWDEPVVVEIPLAVKSTAVADGITLSFPRSGHAQIPRDATIFRVDGRPEDLWVKISMPQDPYYDASVVGNYFCSFRLGESFDGRLVMEEYTAGTVDLLSKSVPIFTPWLRFSPDKPRREDMVLDPNAGTIPPDDGEEDDVF